MLILNKDPNLKPETIISHQEWKFLLHDKGIQAKSSSQVEKPDEISTEAWECASAMSDQLPSFQQLLEHISNNTSLWVEFAESSTPWKFNFREELVHKAELKDKRVSGKAFSMAAVNRFQMLLLVKAFCPGLLAGGMKWFISEEMGTIYSSKVPCTLLSVYKSASSVKPVLIIITPSKNRRHTALHNNMQAVTFMICAQIYVYRLVDVLLAIISFLWIIVFIYYIYTLTF